MEPHLKNSGIGPKLRWLLVIDGILILFVCIALLIRYIPEIYRRYSSWPPSVSGPIVGDKKSEAVEKGVAIQDIQLLPPKIIPRSGIRVIEIVQRDFEKEKRMTQHRVSISNYGGSAPYQGQPEFLRISSQSTVNLLLFSESNPNGFLLFDRQVLIRKAFVPRNPEDPQDYLLFLVADRDSDGDGRLSSMDDQSLWVSDLYGQELNQVTTDSLLFESFSFEENKRRVYIVASLKPSNNTVPREHWEQSLFIYDIDQKKLTPLPIDPANLSKARSLLQQ
jgi:hypothetical protein